jgi:hypothetical protein
MLQNCALRCVRSAGTVKGFATETAQTPTISGGAPDDARQHVSERRAVARRVLPAVPPRGGLEPDRPDYVPVGRSVRAWCAPGAASLARMAS